VSIHQTDNQTSSHSLILIAWSIKIDLNIDRYEY